MSLRELFKIVQDFALLTRTPYFIHFEGLGKFSVYSELKDVVRDTYNYPKAFLSGFCSDGKFSFMSVSGALKTISFWISKA